MRVLTIGNLYPPHDLGGGYELVWQAAVTALGTAGHDVRVLTTDHRNEGTGDGPEPRVDRELRWYWRDHRFPRHGLAATLSLERHNTAVLERHLRDFRPEAIAWWAMGGMSMSLLETARRAGVPTVAFVHDDWLDYGRRVDAWHRRFRGRPRLVAAAMRAGAPPTTVRFADAAHYAFVSRTTRARARLSGVPVPDSSIAPSGIDPGFVDPAPPREWAWELLYVGRIDRRKGILTAVDALARLPPAAVLTVVGDGDPADVASLRERATERGVGARIRLLGGRPHAELPAVYAAADAVLFPVEWHEPWGLVPLEAMACGRPVIATGRGGSAEYLIDGENALLFPAGDAAALADRVERLARDPELRARLCARGVPTAAEHTDERFHAAVAETLLRRVREARAPSPAALPGAEPQLSVVVPVTRVSAAASARIAALAAQATSATEIVVVGEAFDASPAGPPTGVREVPCGERNTRALMDRGCREARGAIVLLLGEDVGATAGLLDAHLAAHRDHPDERSGVTGPLRWVGDMRVSAFTLWLADRLAPAPHAVEGDDVGLLELTTEHVSLKRAVLARAGGLGDDRSPRCVADLDLAQRLGEHGFRLHYVERALALRTRAWSLADLRPRLPGILAAEVELAARWPELGTPLSKALDDASAFGPQQARVARALLPWVPRGTPWLGPRIWERATRHYLQQIAAGDQRR